MAASELLADGEAKPLDGTLVVSLEQAVAAPVCTRRLALAGARVIKVERAEGDFARGYDDYVKGQSTYFVWANHGKESICLDLKDPDDKALMWRLLARADVFVQNLSAGAVDRLGFDSASLKEAAPRLIVCAISGYGSGHALEGMRAYDMLIQAESGFSSVSGGGRVGVSIADILTGINAYGGILEALARRERTGTGDHFSVSLFASMADLMAVPLLQARYHGKGPSYMGMRHPSIVPYGAFPVADGKEVVIAVQNEREWERLCRDVLRSPALAERPEYASNTKRKSHRDEVEASIASITGALSEAELIDRLEAARVAYGRMNTPEDVLAHPAYREVSVGVGDAESARMPAPPLAAPWLTETLGHCPALGEDTQAIRQEFGEDGNS
ncbi:CaiB/BaiF CoA transferase family protein [Ferruginivarius sediminum]|uniref:CoA transferase n=1 Tax=Ferruginivarius sediminum TaxID=2661937 RepID=A0A369T6G9_9PROT|nr:CaiB/BaiF CoA-transferase family protein [Ferruginivarius sediminum]RDD60921.1 CoA transferase [Ferruginivarius sediminum]